MAELFDKLGWMVRILGFVAWMVLVVAAGSILASLHATLNARRREFAVLRALGARPSTLFLVIVTQALVVALLGTLLGFLVHVGMASVASEFLRVRTGVVLSPFAFDSVHVWVPCGMMLLGLAAGAVPAFGAYRTDVETHLSQS